MRLQVSIVRMAIRTTRFEEVTDKFYNNLYIRVSLNFENF